MIRHAAAHGAVADFLIRRTLSAPDDRFDFLRVRAKLERLLARSEPGEEQLDRTTQAILTLAQHDPQKAINLLNRLESNTLEIT
jgi:hypothetical protein